jgi:hypothetical protein
VEELMERRAVALDVAFGSPINKLVERVRRGESGEADGSAVTGLV